MANRRHRLRGRGYAERCFEVTKIVHIGGHTRAELLGERIAANIKLNTHVDTLLASEKFQTTKIRYRVNIIVVSVLDLSFREGVAHSHRRTQAKTKRR
jgi:hypothetical protein